MSQQLPPKLTAAAELIRKKQYEAARVLLQTMPEDKTAVQWLSVLNEIVPESKKTPQKTKTGGASNPILLSAAIGLILLIIVGILAASSQLIPTVFPPLQTVAAVYNVLPQTLTAVSGYFDSLTTALPAYPAYGPTKGWVASTKVAFDNSTAITLTLHDNSGLSLVISPMISVVCQQERLTISLNDFMAYPNFATQTDSPVEYHFDSESPMKFTIPQDNVGNFNFPNPRSLLAAMKTHTMLDVKYASNYEPVTEAHFTLTGLQTALTPMQGHCGQ